MTKKNPAYCITGIEPSDQEDLRRAFDYENSIVDEKLKNPEALRMLKDHFKVSGDGVFYTIQGEGISMGKPCCFLRLHICNLKCSWCDASYTWNPNQKEFWIESQDWTIEETKQKIEEAWEPKDSNIEKLLVITGGEPLLQKDRIDQLMNIMSGWKFEIETNGTVMPTSKILKNVQINCSPKLNNSAGKYELRIKGNVLRALNNVNTIFKFVAMTNEDIDEIENEFIKPFNIDKKKIVIMPQGVTVEEISKNSQRIIERVKKSGFRFLGRLHVDIWGAKRRV